MKTIKINKPDTNIDKILLVFCALSVMLCGAPKIMAKEGFFSVLWLIFACIVSYCYRLDNRIFLINIRRYCIISGWIILTSILLEPPINNYYIVCLLFPLGSCFYMSSVKIGVFKSHLLKVFNFLLAISLIVYLLHQNGIIESYKEDELRYYCFHLFNMKWGVISTPIGEIYKLASIYWEPGQFQIVLNYILCLFIDDIIKHIKSIKYIISHFGLLFLCLILTGSTTGYMSLGVLLIGITSFGVKVKLKYKFLSASLGVLIGLSLFSSSIVQDKFAQKDSNEDNSYNIRMRDNLAALNITMENPIFGAGYCSQKKLSYYLRTGREESSNGWLSTTASFGIPYLFIIFLFMILNLKRRYGLIMGSVVFITLVMSQAGEASTYFPYMWFYIFNWKRKSNIQKVTRKIKFKLSTRNMLN